MGRRVPQRPLRYWRLIELDEPRADVLPMAIRMRIDERIAKSPQGAQRDGRPTRPSRAPGERRAARALPASHERAVADIVVALTELRDGEVPPVVELVGIDPAVRRGLATVAAARLDASCTRSPRSASRPRPASWRPDAHLGARDAPAAGAALRRRGRRCPRGVHRRRRDARGGPQPGRGGLPRAPAAALAPAADHRCPPAHRRRAAGDLGGAPRRRGRARGPAGLRVRSQPGGHRRRRRPGAALGRRTGRPVGRLPGADPPAAGHPGSPGGARRGLGGPRPARRRARAAGPHRRSGPRPVDRPALVGPGRARQAWHRCDRAVRRASRGPARRSPPR